LQLKVLGPKREIYPQILDTSIVNKAYDYIHTTIHVLTKNHWFPYN